MTIAVMETMYVYKFYLRCQCLLYYRDELNNQCSRLCSDGYCVCAYLCYFTRDVIMHIMQSPAQQKGIFTCIFVNFYVRYYALFPYIGVWSLFG